MFKLDTLTGEAKELAEGKPECSPSMEAFNEIDCT